MKRLGRSFLSAVLALVATAFTARLTELPRVGGDGGRRTVTMECPSGTFMVGVTATGGKEGLIGFNLLHRVKFDCRSFTGTTQGSATSTTIEAVGDKPVTDIVSRGSGTCPTNQVLYALELRAGFFIDRLHNGMCISGAQSQTILNINAGGDAGTRAFLQCPAAEGLYKVVARVGDAIDSLKGYCRAFGSVGTLSVPTQINSTHTPKPSSASPLAVPVNSSRTISFTIASIATASVANALIGVSVETDLLGGGIANPPDFKVELINPSGVVVASKTFLDARAGFVLGVTYQINANGTWKFRITNLKRDIGTLNVRDFSGSAAI